MNRKTVLPDALTKGDYFRNRAASNSRSPTRRPARKTLTNGEAKAFAPTEPAKLQQSAPTREQQQPRLPHINGSSANSDKGSDKSSNGVGGGDTMTGEVTVAFIDYRLDPNIIKKRPADQMHNVKIIQYIGQGKQASRVNHEFWMQNETAAKFPVIQQSVSSRTSLNFAFYLDGQFFHRLSVCCLNKLRTTHQIIGTKFVHFKVIDVTNIVLCFRCKGHEYMQQSFKKAGSAPLRSTSLPRRSAAAAATTVTSPDVADPTKLLRVNGNSPLGLKRSRSISKTRTAAAAQQQQPPIALPRALTTTTSAAAKSSSGASTDLRKNGTTNTGEARKKTDRSRAANLNVTQQVPQQQQQNHTAFSDNKEKMLENYCEDRLSPVSTRRSQTNGLGLLNGDGGSEKSSPTDEKELVTEAPQNVRDVSGEVTAENTLPRAQRVYIPLAGMGLDQVPESPVVQQAAPGHGQSSATATVTVHTEVPPNPDKSSQPSSRKTSRARKPSSGVRQPVLATEAIRRPLSRHDSEADTLRETSVVEPSEALRKKSSAASQPGSERESRSRKPSATINRRGSITEVPVLEKYQNELFGGATGEETGDFDKTAETIVRDATEGAIAQTQTAVRNGEPLSEETSEDLRRGSLTSVGARRSSETAVRSADEPAKAVGPVTDSQVWTADEIAETTEKCPETRAKDPTETQVQDSSEATRRCSFCANKDSDTQGEPPNGDRRCSYCDGKDGSTARRCSYCENKGSDTPGEPPSETRRCSYCDGKDGSTARRCSYCENKDSDTQGEPPNPERRCSYCDGKNDIRRESETGARGVPRMSSQPLRSNPATPRNVDPAEDMIELAHDESAGGATGEMPPGSIIHNKEEHPQSEYVNRKHSDTDTQVRDVTAADENVPSLAKEDPVAFAWPDTDGKATHSHPETPPEKSKENFAWPDASEPGSRKPSASARSRHVSVEIMDRGAVISESVDSERPVSAVEDKDKPNTTFAEDAAKTGTDRADSGTPTTAVRDDVPLDEVELKRKKSIGKPDAERSTTPKNRAAKGSIKSMSLNHGDSFDRSGLEVRRDSTPHSAEEFIEQLGYSEELPRPPSVTEEGAARPGTATHADRRSSSAAGQLPVIGNEDYLPDTHVHDHVVVAKVRRPTLEHLGTSQDSAPPHVHEVVKAEEEVEEKPEKKPPSTPHNAGDMITQLGFGSG